MGKILGIDFGLKRTGLSITDDLNVFAFGLDTVDSKNLIVFLRELILKENIDKIVLGLPKGLNNEDTNITQNVYLLKNELEKKFINIKVILLDERFTSKIASQSIHSAGARKKHKQDKRLVDKVSATIILQSYLSSL